MRLRTATLALAVLWSGSPAAGPPTGIPKCNQALAAAEKGDFATAADLQSKCIAKAGKKATAAPLHVFLAKKGPAPINRVDACAENGVRDTSIFAAPS